MNTVTHALTMNGRINTEVKDPVDPADVIIRKRLSLLDGSLRFSLILWAMPRGMQLDDVDLDNWPSEYIQAAGSRERMTVEVRRIEANRPRQYVVGRDTHSDDERPEVIRWDGVETLVQQSEVFTADQGADLFVSYYATGWIPPTYTLRLLDL